MSCTRLRRKLVTFGHFSVAQGDFVADGKEWRVEPCGTPLFGAAERQAGLCRSCLKGWTHPHNYPADQPQPLREMGGS
jgi:hypothetical protein